MELVLDAIGKKVGAQQWLYDLSLAPRSGAVTVLLGATQAGKTSLLRIMAGLDRPTTGKVRVDGRDVTGLTVRERDVSMVYQQFINYPSMRVADNIASPLRLRGAPDIAARVRDIAARLHIEAFLDRYPSELSGGQQQRVALARALAKQAPLMLLDEPLVNLDYKLREELRDELTQLFDTGDTTVVYATTEPAEALLLGGYTAVLDAGELLQYGPTAEVFHAPRSLNLAAGLEDDIIRTLRPPWNGGKPEQVGANELREAATASPPTPVVLHEFKVPLAPTYHRTGFFNVGVADQHVLGGDGETIELFLGSAQDPVTGTINRRANGNGTPRVIGGTAVRDWFGTEGEPGDVLRVEVYSPNSIRLAVVR